MPIKSNNIKSASDKITAEIVKKAKVAATKSAIIALEQAMLYTPLQFNTLRNSQFRTAPDMMGTIVSVSLGYTAKYAAALHERTDWKPRAVGQRGKKKGGANMRATPKFLERGIKETKDIRFRIVKDEMKL